MLPELLIVTALVTPAPGQGGHRAIASRAIVEGERQYPWLLRLDPEGRLEGGVNVSGTDIVLCRAPVVVATSVATLVGMRHDGRSLSLTIAGQEVARCRAEGRIQNRSGAVVVGALVNAPNPGPSGPRHQILVGDVSITALRDVHSTPPRAPHQRRTP